MRRRREAARDGIRHGGSRGGIGGPWGPDLTNLDNDTSNLMSAAARAHVSHQLEQLRQPKVESLTNYINSRIQVARTTPHVLPREEGAYILR